MFFTWLEGLWCVRLDMDNDAYWQAQVKLHIVNPGYCNFVERNKNSLLGERILPILSIFQRKYASRNVALLIFFNSKLEQMTCVIYLFIVIIYLLLYVIFLLLYWDNRGWQYRTNYTKVITHGKCFTWFCYCLTRIVIKRTNTSNQSTIPATLHLNACLNAIGFFQKLQPLMK